MAKQIGIHATPKRHFARIQREGLKPQWFWMGRRWIKSPRKFKLKYHAKVNVISGKTETQLVESVYDSLNCANANIVGSAIQKFRIRDLRLFVVEAGKSVVSKRKRKYFLVRTSHDKSKRIKGQELEELELEAPPSAVKPLALSKEELDALSRKARGMSAFEANMLFSWAIAKKLMKWLE